MKPSLDTLIGTGKQEVRMGLIEYIRKNPENRDFETFYEKVGCGEIAKFAQAKLPEHIAIGRSDVEITASHYKDEIEKTVGTLTETENVRLYLEKQLLLYLLRLGKELWHPLLYYRSLSYHSMKGNVNDQDEEEMESLALMFEEEGFDVEFLKVW